MGLFFVGAIGFVISLVLLIVRKKSRKTFGILTGLFLLIAIAGMISAMNTPAIETVKADYDKIMAGEMNGEIIDLAGDIENIERDGDLYFITVNSPDGVYQLATTEDVAGEFPRVGDKRVKMYVTPEHSASGDLVITIISFRK